MQGPRNNGFVFVCFDATASRLRVSLCSCNMISSTKRALFTFLFFETCDQLAWDNLSDLSERRRGWVYRMQLSGRLYLAACSDLGSDVAQAPLNVTLDSGDDRGVYHSLVTCSRRGPAFLMMALLLFVFDPPALTSRDFLSARATWLPPPN